MSKETQSKSGTIGPLALGAAAIVFGGFVPLPGIDFESLQALLGDGGGPWDLSIGPIGNTVGALVLAYAFALSSTRTWAWRAALVFYLVGAMIQGLGIAFWLEGLNGGYGGLGSLDVVMEPGWPFRFTVMLAYAAGASILWFISRSIDATKRVTGALFLLLVRVLIDQVGIFSSYGNSFARGEMQWSQALPLLAMPASIIILAVVLYQRPAAKWPVMLWRWKLHSHLDVIALVAVSVLPGALARLGALAGMQPVWFDLFDALLALGLGISACFWWWKLASADHENGGSAKTLVAVCVATFGLLAAGVFGFASAGGIERFTAPLPLEGTRSFTLTLDAEETFEPEDAETMVALLEELGASVEIVSASERSIRLNVSDAIGREPVLQVLTPANFLISGVLNIQQHAPPEVLRRGTPSRYQSVYLEGECAAFEGLAGTTNETGGGADLPTQRCRFAIQAVAEPYECELYCIADEPVLTSSDVQEAFVTVGEYDNHPAVSIVLTDEAALRFENYTADHIEEAIAIEVKGELLSAPIVQSRIGGGRVQVTMGRSADFDAMLREADQLAAVLRPGGVRTPWRLRAE